MRIANTFLSQDWDFKFEKGNCLNSLGSQKFELTQSNLMSSSSSVPKAVKRVHEIFDKPTFMRDVNPGDVKQGNLGDCWLMASLSALANTKDGIKRLCVAYNTSEFYMQSNQMMTETVF